MATIVILEHLLQREVKLPYMVYQLAERWRAAGHRVIVHHGFQNPPPGDLAVNNIDLTVVPEGYRELLGRYRRVINGAVLDVSKSRFSEQRLRPGDAWTGAVIVKTEANFGGKPEQLLRSLAMKSGMPCDIPAGPVADGYPTYASLREMPESVWSVPGLIVEKFLPERDERGYYIRIWTFFGARERSSRFRADVPIIKSEHVRDREPVQVPDQIRAWRDRLRFDYGKFDYVKAHGRFLLLDANRTPSLPPEFAPRAAETVDLLAGGLEDYLR
ncbi:MAG: hypothetical protein A3G83_06920 [Betaproteobacteria bacterium RIFCSPLOWO2_12_FULL_68_20]|nr:MAG: hypothetical protein A3G83_06920 [Betaproteobacteria bacterium RIFCSPLOWO2_12_FULL_68_20]